MSATARARSQGMAWVLGLLVAGACAGPEATDGPRVDRVAPPQAAIGARVEILGVGFAPGSGVAADAGTSPVDAGAGVADATPPQDTGQVLDAADGAPDAGAILDAGPGLDGGSGAPDAGAILDAGPGLDGGSGAPDAGAALDAAAGARDAPAPPVDAGPCDPPAGAFVAFGAVAAPVTCWTATRITAVVPEEAPIGPTTIVVTVGGRPSPPVAFEVVP